MNKNLAHRIFSPFFLFSYILVFLPCTLLSQVRSNSKRADSRGFVFEQESKKPIPGATVNLPQYGMYAITDSNGMFLFRQVPTGATDISIRVIGMVSIEKKLSIDEENNFALKCGISHTLAVQLTECSLTETI